MHVSFVGWMATDILIYIEKQLRERLPDGTIPYVSIVDVDILMDKDPGGSQVPLFIDDLVEQWAPISGDPKYGEERELCDHEILDPIGHLTLAEPAMVSASYREPYRQITRHRRFRSSVSARTA